MRDEDKSREQLIDELQSLRSQLIVANADSELRQSVGYTIRTPEEALPPEGSPPSDLIWNPEDANIPILDDRGYDDAPRLLSDPEDEVVRRDSGGWSTDVTDTGSFNLTWITMASFGKLLHAIPMPILLTNATGVIRFENHSFMTISGELYTATGDSIYSLFGDTEEAEHVEELVAKVLNLRIPQVREGMIVVNGTEIWSRMHIRSIRFGNERSLLALIEDLTTEKRELTLNEKYGKLVHTFPIGIAEFDLKQEVPGSLEEEELLSLILDSPVGGGNARFAWLSGHKDFEAVKGTPFRKLLPSKQNDLQLYRKWIQDGFTIHYFETKEKRSDGDLRYFETTLVGNVQDNVLVQFWVMKQDITQRKKIHQELLQKITTIDELYEHIVESGKAKAIGEHTATVAHELRQPLAIIGGFARRMSKECSGCPGNVDGARDQTLSLIVKEVQRLEKILGGLIDFSRREDVALKRVNPNDLIEYVLRINKQRMEEKNLLLQLNTGCEIGDIRVDPDRFSQVIRNLVANAIEASPPDETIVVDTGVAMPSDKAQQTGELASATYFEMKIQNRGKPISHEHLEKIFNPFFTTKDFGTGLGLTLSKKIVEDHGGSISVKSDEKCTILTVWLPMGLSVD
jgi:PAS domain S-box-containing protein